MKQIKKWLKLIWRFFYVKDVKGELIKGMQNGANKRASFKKGGKK